MVRLPSRHPARQMNTATTIAAMASPSANPNPAAAIPASTASEDHMSEPKCSASASSARLEVCAATRFCATALAGWRPTVVFQGQAGYSWGHESEFGQSFKANRDLGSALATATQPLYMGGRTRASTSQAENAVMAERARLIQAEQQAFLDGINAYVTVVADKQVLDYSVHDDGVGWTLESSKQQRAQEGRYTLTPDGDSTRVRFDLTVDLSAPVPGFLVKRGAKGLMETATDGLRKRVLEVKGGK